MSIELTTEQAEAIASQPDSVVVINPQTKQVYRLIREDVFQKWQRSRARLSRISMIRTTANTWTLHELQPWRYSHRPRPQR